MDGTVSILEVHVGAVAMYRACADECPPADVDRRRYLRERYVKGRHVTREIGKARLALENADGLPLAEFDHFLHLVRRRSSLLGLYAPRQVEVDPTSADGLPAAEVVRRVREILRQEDESDQ
jgi:hypothetical protein